MKQKVKIWFLRWSGLIAFFWCLGCCVFAGIKGHLDEFLVLMPFCFLWFMFWAQGRICDKLAQHNGELMHKNDELSKFCEESSDNANTCYQEAQYYLHKYLNAQADADYCKYKINTTDYLSKKRYLEMVIELYAKELKRKGINV